MPAPDDAISMVERPSQSFEVPPQRSSSLNYHVNPATGDLQFERPNRVLSGHRNLARTFYTGPRGPRTNFENHANRIVAKLEENEALLDDTPVSEQLRKEALRDLPQCLTMKRCVKMKLTKSVSQKSRRKPIGWWKSFKYRTSITFNKFVSSLKNFNYFQLWHSSLKDIEGHFGSGYASYFKFLRWLFVMNFIVAVLSMSLLVVPQIIYDASGVNGTITNTRGFEFKNLFFGDGLFFESFLYYGHYTHNVINVIPHLNYDMPAAYFATTVLLYLFCFVVLAVSVAESYRRNFIETEGGFQNIFANRVFCGWDFGIATKEAAELKNSSIYNELKELLSEQNVDQEEHTCLYKFWTYSIQIVVNILVFAILALIGWSTWLLLDQFSLKDDSSVIVIPIIINIAMMILPTIFNFIAKYEDYKNPRITLYITLTRIYILGAVIIGNILAYWLIKAGNTDCWQNRLGAETYRLIIFDFIFSVILATIFDVGYFVGQYFRGSDPKSEFNIARHTLQIIYNQGLFWVGFVYSPVLPALVTLKMLLIWYVRKGCVRKLCRPPMRTWRAAQAQTWFMMMVFVSILLIIATHGYALSSIGASTCGPFQDYDFIYEIVTDNVANLEQDEAFWKVTLNVTKPGGVALVMIALIILVYYLKAHAHAQKEKVKVLREMLVWMVRDKKFLVQWYNEVTNGEIKTKLRDNRFMDPSKIQPFQYFGDCPGSIDEDEFAARFKKFS